MSEEIALRVNGAEVRVAPGTVVAAAIARAGAPRFRRSVNGQERGPLCGMGICMECRVTINGETQQRSCQMVCEPGMEVFTDAPAAAQNKVGMALRAGPSIFPIGADASRYAHEGKKGTGSESHPYLGNDRRLPATGSEIVIVGAGPAGLSAATVAAECGRRVLLVDETPWLGGQIWRGEQAHPSAPAAREWLQRFQRSGAELLAGTSIIACPQPGVLQGESPDGPREIRYEKLVLAAGARELFLPFPGWTLPGVMGPGGLLSLAKHGWPVAGKRVVIAGSGPLLLAAADGLKKLGATVTLIAEQAPLARLIEFSARLIEHPAKLWQGIGIKRRLWNVPYRCGVWPVRADGDDQFRRVALTDGVRTWTEDCDLLACGFGLVPNLELALALGCKLFDGCVRADDRMQTSVENVYCAGEAAGIGGADAALVDGCIAGYAAAGAEDKARALSGQRTAWGRFRVALKKSFALRPELKLLATDDTVVCRCEDVTLGRLKGFSGWRDAKLQTRCGMGACQGRVCGAALQVLRGWGAPSVRPPVLPARLESLTISKT